MQPPFPAQQELNIRLLSKPEILGEIERATDNAHIYTVMMIRDQLIDMIPPHTKMGDLVECLRYSERALGVLVRRGQQGPDRYISARNQTSPGMRSSAEFFTANQERFAAFKMADGVSDEQFVAAIERCKANGSLARARVVEAITDKPPEWVRNTARPEPLRRRRIFDKDRALEQSINQMYSIFDGLDALLPDRDSFDGIDPATARKWEQELSELTGRMRTLRTNIKRGQAASNGE